MAVLGGVRFLMSEVPLYLLILQNLPFDFGLKVVVDGVKVGRRVTFPLKLWELEPLKSKTQLTPCGTSPLPSKVSSRPKIDDVVPHTRNVNFSIQGYYAHKRQPNTLEQP